MVSRERSVPIDTPTVVAPARPAVRGRLRLTMLGVGVVATLVATLAIDARASNGARVTGDEPQYLLSALSVGEDLDLDISDEIAGRRYLEFHEAALDQQTLALNDSGQELSPHDPLLPILLALPMRVGGWVGAKLALAAIAGLTAAATLWLAVVRLRVSVPIGAVVVTAFSVTPPLVAYGNQVYPELPAALAVLIACGAATGSLRRRELVVAKTAIVALPWLAVKYVPVAGALGVVVVGRLARRSARRELWWLGVAVLLAAATYVVVHRRVYGGWTVYAAGDHFVGDELSVVGRSPSYVGRSERLIGLLVDRAFGLVAWAPAWLLAVPAGAALGRRRPPGWFALAAPVATGWAVATWVALTMHGWWWPGRQVVVVLPLVVVAIAWWIETQGRRARLLLGALVIATALGLWSWCFVVVEASTGASTLVVDFAQTADPWYRLWRLALPDMRASSAHSALLTVTWIVVVVGLATLGWRSVGPRVGTGADAAAIPSRPPRGRFD